MNKLHYCPLKYPLTKDMTEIIPFNLTFSCIDDNVMSIDNPNFVNRIPLIYFKEVEIKETTEMLSSALNKGPLTISSNIF